MSASSIQDEHDLWKKVQAIRFAMVTTQDQHGMLRSRPMTIQQIEEPGTMWFFSSDASALADSLRDNPHVNVAIADTDDDTYVSIVGKASIVHDRDKAAELWSTPAKAWFPKGLDDPHLALIRVDMVDADYWNTEESKMVQVFKMARAAMTGNPPDMGERGHVSVAPRSN